jgi:hypothetical protein
VTTCPASTTFAADVGPETAAATQLILQAIEATVSSRT